MLQYIKKKIDENNVNTDNDFDDSEMIVECAHLFQELSDLSVEGTDADSARKMVIDIPLEDDIELDSVEINIGDGRLTDIPMDAAVQESDRTEMKTFDDFYQEACVSVVKLQRETDEAHDNRITRVANSNYTQYKNQIVQEGLFGFNKISINDSVVPSVVTVNFGPLSPDKPDQNYYVKLDVLFEIDKRKRLLKKQLESVNAAIDGDKFVGLSTYAFKYLNEKFPDEMKGVKSAWDVLTPKKLLVPKDPVDYLILYVQFECSFRIDGENKLLLTWSRSIKPVKNGVKANIQAIADKSAVSRMMSKKDYVQESYELSRPSRFGKTYQEAIDFGSDGVPEPSVEVAPSDETDQANPDTTDVPAGEDTTPVDSNDVSDAIVDKVANDNEVDNGDGQDIPPTMDEPPIDDTGDDTLPSTGVDDVTDIPVDGDDTSDTDQQLDGDDTSNTDQQLDDLNDMGNTESEVDGDVSMDIDVENMTIDELLNQGSDKLKNMTINQLKEFLSDENNAEQIQEAFFFSNKNINNKLDVELRKTLGILNDSDMELVDILTSFRKQGKTLNKVLGKAIRNKKVYSTEEIGSLNKLNKCLITVLNAIKTEKDNNYDMTVKRLIQAFVSDSAIVGKIIESKKSKPEGAEDNE